MRACASVNVSVPLTSSALSLPLWRAFSPFRVTSVDATKLNPVRAYYVNHAVMDIMDKLNLGGYCRRVLVSEGRDQPREMSYGRQTSGRSSQEETELKGDDELRA